MVYGFSIPDRLKGWPPAVIIVITQVWLNSEVEKEISSHQDSYHIWDMPAGDFAGLFMASGIVLFMLTFLPFELSEDEQIRALFYYALWLGAICYAIVGIYLIQYVVSEGKHVIVV